MSRQEMYDTAEPGVDPRQLVDEWERKAVKTCLRFALDHPCCPTFALAARDCQSMVRQERELSGLCYASLRDWIHEQTRISPSRELIREILQFGV